MARPRSAPALGALLIALALLGALFFALGCWQVERLAWKQDLISRVERQVKAPPQPAPGPTEWRALARERDEYRVLRLRGRFDHDRETLVHAATVLGTDYWVLTPLRTDDGRWVLVNRGFVPPELRDAAGRRAQAPKGEFNITGLLRFSEPAGSALRHNDPSQDRWYSRDVAAIARARGLDGAAPFFVDASAKGTPAGAWPRPGLTVLHFSNNHRIYAATWFALAAMAACAIGYLVIDERRLRRLAGAARVPRGAYTAGSPAPAAGQQAASAATCSAGSGRA